MTTNEASDGPREPEGPDAVDAAAALTTPDAEVATEEPSAAPPKRPTRTRAATTRTTAPKTSAAPKTTAKKAAAETSADAAAAPEGEAAPEAEPAPDAKPAKRSTRATATTAAEDAAPAADVAPKTPAKRTTTRKTAAKTTDEAPATPAPAEAGPPTDAAPAAPAPVAAAPADAAPARATAPAPAEAPAPTPATATPQDAAAAAAARPSERVQHNGRRVVVAEDEALIRLDVVETLSEAGFDVVGEAGDGELAVSLATSLRPDVVVMDIKMPVLDGISAAERIGKARIAPVVLLTAFSQTELVERARDAGAMAYVVKPFTPQELLPAIEIAIARHAEITALEEEVADLAERFETRKRVERAKGLLMTKMGLTEPESFRWIQKTSMDRRLTMREVADAVIEQVGATDKTR